MPCRIASASEGAPAPSPTACLSTGCTRHATAPSCAQMRKNASARWVQYPCACSDALIRSLSSSMATAISVSLCWCPCGAVSLRLLWCPNQVLVKQHGHCNICELMLMPLWGSFPSILAAAHFSVSIWVMHFKCTTSGVSNL